MDKLIIFFAIASILIFFYESSIAPSLRMVLRYDLFKLRDRVRTIKIENPEKFQDNLFNYFDNSICRTIQFLSNISITDFINSIRVSINHKNAEHPDVVATTAIDKHEIEELKKIREEYFLLFCKAMVINSTVWIVIWIPIFIFLIVVAIIVRMFKKLEIRKRLERQIIFFQEWINTNGNMSKPYAEFDC